MRITRKGNPTEKVMVLRNTMKTKAARFGSQSAGEEGTMQRKISRSLHRDTNLLMCRGEVSKEK